LLEFTAIFIYNGKGIFLAFYRVWEYAMSEAIGRRIKAAREKRHWSQAKLANVVGVSPLSVHRWEHGEAMPHHENRQALIEQLGMHEEDFL
jgi:ribosome-binding protein aMBF1 (putative translation factor)